MEQQLTSFLKKTGVQRIIFTAGSMVLSFGLGILTHQQHIESQFTDPVIQLPIQPVPEFAQYKNQIAINTFDFIPAEENITSTTTVSQQQNFIASKSGTKYYPIGCGTANRINQENRIYFATEQEAQDKGYSRTATCN